MFKKKAKRTVSWLLMLAIMILSIPTSVVAATDDNSGIIAYDDVNYPEITADTEMNTNSKYRSGGEGFAGMWVSSADHFSQSNPSLGANRQVRLYDGLHFYCVVSAGGFLYRQLAAPLDLSKEGVYYYKFNARTNISSLTRYHAAKFFLGSNITIALEQCNAGENPSDATLDAGVYPTLDVNGSKVWGATESMAYVNRSFLLKITADADGPETFQLQYANDAASLSLDENDFQMTLTAECGTSTVDYIGMQSITFGGAALGAHELHRYNAEDLEQLKAAEASIAGGEDLTEEEVRTAISLLSKIKQGFIYDHYISIIKDYILDNNLTSTFKPVLTSTTVADDDVVTAAELESIELEFSSNMAQDVGNFSLVDSEGTDVLEDVETSENKVKLTLSALSPNESYTLTANGLADFMGIPAEDITINFFTDFIPMVNILEGAEVETGTVLSWEDLEGIVTTATVNGAQVANGAALSGTGPVVLVIIATNESGIEKSQEIRFTLVDAYAPVASNVRIEVGDAGVLTGAFDYTDKNGDEKGTCTYAWYYTNKDGSNPVAIENAETNTYTISERDYNKYIVFEVTPVALTGNNKVGSPVKSVPYVTPSKPKATAVKISGNARLGEKLKLNFLFEDENEDAAGTHRYAWYTSETENGILTPETLTPIAGAESAEFALTETSIDTVKDKYLTASVIPVSAEAPAEGEIVYASCILGPATPVVSNVKITGTAKVGSLLTGDYVFFDANLDEEGESVLEWINNDTGEVLATGRTMTPTTSMAGKNVALRVVGKSIYAPFESVAAVSSAVKISSSSGSSSNSGNKGFSISGSSSGSVKPVVQPVVPTPDDNTSSKTIFNDVKGHWAEEAILALYEKNIVSGTGNGTYEPDRIVTRAEIIKLFMSCSDVVSAQYDGIFKDVSESDWFAGYVQSALNAGLIAEDETFRPGDAVTRQETAKLIAVFKGLALSQTQPAYSDAESIAEWAVPYVAAVTEGGFMNGNDLGDFMPTKQLTRAEAATIIWRLIK